VKNGIWYCWIDYNGTAKVMEVRLSQTSTRPATATLSKTVDLATDLSNSSSLFFGFTASSGYDSAMAPLATATIDILSWALSNVYSPIGSSPSLTASVTQAIYDPIPSNLKAIPGNDVVTSTILTNTGGSPDANSLSFILPVNSNTKLKTGSVAFTDAVGGSASGLTLGTVVYTSTSPCPTSKTDGAWGNYTPSGAYDPNVTGIKVTPSGTFNSGTAGSPSGFKISYQTQIK
jgi:hypothetical protein